MKKRTLLLFIATVIMLLSLVALIIIKDTDTEQTTINNVEIKLGDYIQFGSYLEQVIEWKVIDFDDHGDPLLLSKDNITIKSYDSIGEKHEHQLDKENTINGDTLRKTKGSNYWEASNIRQWLNSESKHIEWLRNPPTLSPSLSDKVGGYAKEEGFLNKKNFSKDEVNALNHIEYKVTLNKQDLAISEGGSRAQSFSTDLLESTEEYDLSYHQILKDRVSLLSTQEVKELLYDRGLEITAHSTLAAYVQVFGDDNGYRDGSFLSDYWLRSPITDLNKPMKAIIVEGDSTKVTDGDNHDLGEQVVTFSSGIRPVISLNLSKISFTKGDGTLNLPYKAKARNK